MILPESPTSVPPSGRVALETMRVDALSAAPYIGEESTSRPPSSTKRRSTSRKGSRCPGRGPTSNVRHVPSPTAGTVSPVDGMARVTSVHASS